MSDEASKSSKRVLEPIERVSEVLFGLIMVLTFTGSLSVAESGRDDVRTMLIGALGCNIAWGIIDGIFYLMGSLAEKGRGLIAFRAVRKATNPEEARGIVADALPPVIAAILEPAELDAMSRRLQELPEPSGHMSFRRSDWLGAIGVFLLVFLSTFPVVLPFVFVSEIHLAMRISNGIAIAMMYVAGHFLGKHAGLRPIPTGLVMVALGVVLVGITIALGG